jgi:hypothetical protein
MAGNAAVASIMRQGFGPPIVYAPSVRELMELQQPPQDLIKDDPMDPGSGRPVEELRDNRLAKLRARGPQPRSGDEPAGQAVDPRWRAMRAAYPEGGLAARFIDHYANGGGKELTLTTADALEAAPIITLASTTSRGGEKGISNHVGLHREIEALKRAGGGTKRVAFQGTGSAATHGTLGSFTILYDGELTVAKPGEQLDDMGSAWHFKGTAIFYDVYDCESRGDRHPAAEIMTGVGRYGMSGDPFRIVSDPLAVEQTDRMFHAVIEGKSADGAGGKPSKVAPVLKKVLPDPMAGSGSSAGW